MFRGAKCKAELRSPGTDWELSWSLSRLKGLGSEATSFLWKLLHCILPAEERLSRTPALAVSFVLNKC